MRSRLSFNDAQHSGGTYENRNICRYFLNSDLSDRYSGRQRNESLIWRSIQFFEPDIPCSLKLIPCYAEIFPCYFFKGIQLKTLMDAAFCNDIVDISGLIFRFSL